MASQFIFFFCPIQVWRGKDF